MAKSISGQTPSPSSFASLERTLDRTIDYLVKSDPTAEVRALLIEARRLRSVVANWRSIPPPADVHEEMLDRVVHLSTAAGTPQKDWQAWDDETYVGEPDVPSLVIDPEKTTGYKPDFDRSRYNLDSDEPPPDSSGSMVLWTPKINEGEVIAPPPPSLGFGPKDPSLAQTSIWHPPVRLDAATQPIEVVHPSNAPNPARSPALARIPDAEIVVANEPTPAGLERRTPDGRIELRHPDGRTETRHTDGRIELRYPDGRLETNYSDGRHETRFADGRIELRYADGALETRYTDGRIETRYSDGRIETAYTDGRIETRHADGRVETRWSTNTIEKSSGAKRVVEPLDQIPTTHIETRPIRLPEPLPQHIVLVSDPYSERADSFRALRRKLAAASNPKTIAVMSPSSGEGKTTTALNLAFALRETARARVLFLEANMRAPSVAKLLQFEPPECFVNQMITHRDDPDQPWTVAEQGGSLHLLVVNPVTDRPPLLDPVAFNTAMERLKRAYEYIVIDTPPALGNVDANLIADASDGVLMTSWELKTTKGTLKKAIKQLVPAPILGMVMIEA